MNLKMQTELRKQKELSKYGEMPKQMALAFLIAMIGLGIAYLLIMVAGWVAGGENAMKMPKLMMSRQVEASPTPGETFEEGLELIEDWSDTVGEETQGIEASGADKVTKYGKQVADMVGQGFLVAAIVIVLVFVIIFGVKSGVKGAAFGAVFGAVIGAGIYLIWYNLYNGHLVPFIIAMGISGFAVWHPGGLAGWAIGLSVTMIISFWVMIYPKSWNVVNILNIVEADSWYDFWDMIQGGDFGIFNR